MVFNFVVEVLKSSTVELLISDPHGAEPRLEHKQVDSQRSKKTLLKIIKYFTRICRKTRIFNKHGDYVRTEQA